MCAGARPGQQNQLRVRGWLPPATSCVFHTNALRTTIRGTNEQRCYEFPIHQDCPLSDLRFFHAVAPTLLGKVQRLIGSRQRDGDAGVATQHGRYADADGDRDA